MKKTCLITGSLLAAVLLVAAAPGNSSAGVQIHIGFPLPVPGFLPPPPPPPPLVVPKPPRLVVLQGSDVYCHSDDRDALYYGGYWYRSRGRAWFRAAAYDGPWSFIAEHRVPRAVLIVPADYYFDRDSHDYDRHHHHEKKHCKRWRHHDRHDRHDGHGRWDHDRRSRHDRWD